MGGHRNRVAPQDVAQRIGAVNPSCRVSPSRTAKKARHASPKAPFRAYIGVTGHALRTVPKHSTG